MLLEQFRPKIRRNISRNRPCFPWRSIIYREVRSSISCARKFAGKSRGVRSCWFSSGVGVRGLWTLTGDEHLADGESGDELCGGWGSEVSSSSCKIERVAIGVTFAVGNVVRGTLGLRGETRSPAAARFDKGPLRGWRPRSSSSLGLFWNCRV